MASVIATLGKLEDSSLAPSWASLADVLLKEPCYTKVAEIARFIFFRLLPQWMNSKNEAQLRADEVDLTLVLTYLNVPASIADWSVHYFQGAINQLLCAATSTENQADPHLQQAAEQLRTAYLLSPTVNEAGAALETIQNGLSRETYMFTSRDGRQAVALDPELFKGLVSAAPGVALTNGYLLTRPSETGPFKNESIADVWQVYAMQPLLKVCHAALKQGKILSNLVGGILGDSPHSSTFVEVLNHHTVPIDLVTPEHQSELHETFAAHWQVAEGEIDDPQNPSRHLRPEHQEQLWQAVEHLGLDDTPHNRAALMLILSSIFTRYSSSYLFGAEYESPIAVRLYASALLNEARRLAPSLIDDKTATDCRAILLGIGQAFTCTAMLSTTMNDYLKNTTQPDSPLERLSLALYPIAWR